MALLIQFLLRLTFGLAAGMFITSSKLVTSGYFRNHLYVTLGLTTLAALLSYSVAPAKFWYAVLGAGVSYIGSVCWLYEKPKAGKVALLLVALASLMGSLRLIGHDYETKSLEKYFQNLGSNETISTADASAMKIRFMRLGINAVFLSIISTVSSGLLLGMTMAAMLLGHWYLNTPTMEMAPLQRLILAMGAAVALQAAVSLLGLWGEITYGGSLSTQWILFLVLRWSFGLIGVGALAWMAWQTLKIPNTQSATGILYVAVIGTFVGETMALLLSTESLFPL
jgi:hypothetical protein